MPIRIITTEKKPIKMWLPELEEGALAQARNLANLPFTFQWVAIMPDSHEGYGMPIGGVLAARDVVIPNGVGVDIGCGVAAVRTTVESESLSRDELGKMMKLMREQIPLGFKHHRERKEWEGFRRAPVVPVIQEELDAARYQLGTLGSGNHFLELQRGDDGYLWLMLHSGSRNFGLKIAREYHGQALRHCQKEGIPLVDKELAWLPVTGREGREYLAAMNFALEFARASRGAMMEKMKQAVGAVRKGAGFTETLDVHHNYAAKEVHYGEEVFVHRKGATSAKAGEAGIIPGSQGTKSYVVEGKGHPESFMSCSHGAGRKLGRKQAIRELDMEKEKKFLEDQGILHSLRHQRDLEEAAGAYKDIEEVMAHQAELVDIKVTLTPLAVIKG